MKTINQRRSSGRKNNKTAQTITNISQEPKLLFKFNIKTYTIKSAS